MGFVGGFSDAKIMANLAVEFDANLIHRVYKTIPGDNDRNTNVGRLLIGNALDMGQHIIGAVDWHCAYS